MQVLCNAAIVLKYMTSLVTDRIFKPNYRIPTSAIKRTLVTMYCVAELQYNIVALYSRKGTSRVAFMQKVEVQSSSRAVYAKVARMRTGGRFSYDI